MAEPAAKRQTGSGGPDGLNVEVKKLKPDHENGREAGREAGSENILSAFKTSAVLNDSARDKIIFIHGKVADQDAVVILEKTPVRQDSLDELFSGSTLNLEMRNDIYSTYRLQAPPHLNEIKTTVVCPATEKHVKKYQRQESFLVEETAEDYRSITLPYIQKQSFSVQWVYNVLEKKAEAERILYEDPDPQLGFLLLPDFKWDQKQTRERYFLVSIIEDNMRVKCIRPPPPPTPPPGGRFIPAGFSTSEEHQESERSEVRTSAAAAERPPERKGADPAALQASLQSAEGLPALPAVLLPPARPLHQAGLRGSGLRRGTSPPPHRRHPEPAVRPAVLRDPDALLPPEGRRRAAGKVQGGGKTVADPPRFPSFL